jgi:2-octaprenyl-6-methoxyphenol hydroxylase
MNTPENAPENRFEPADIAIVGAGPVGGALACQLAAAGKKIILIDQAALPPMEHPDFDGRAYAIAAGSKRLLDEAGLWEQLPYPPCPILDIKVTDGKPGYPASPLQLQFDHRAVGDAPFGWIIEARALRIAINRQIMRPPTSLYWRRPRQRFVSVTMPRRLKQPVARSRCGW